MRKKNFKEIKRHLKSIAHFQKKYKESDYKVLKYNKDLNLSIWEAKVLFDEDGSTKMDGVTFVSDMYGGVNDFIIVVSKKACPHFEATLLHEFLHFVGFYTGSEAFKSDETEEMFAHTYENLVKTIMPLIKKKNGV